MARLNIAASDCSSDLEAAADMGMREVTLPGMMSLIIEPL